MFCINTPGLLIIVIVAGLMGMYLGIKKGISITNPLWLKEGFWQRYPYLLLSSDKKWRGEIISSVLYISVLYISVLYISVVSIVIAVVSVVSVFFIFLLSMLLGTWDFSSLFIHVFIAPLGAFTVMFITNVIHIVLLDWIKDGLNP